MAHDDARGDTPTDIADGLDAPPARLDEPAITRAAKLCLTHPTGEEWAKVAVAGCSRAATASAPPASRMRRDGLSLMRSHSRSEKP